MALTIEQTILKNLIQNDEFIRKTLPFIKEEFFQERQEQFLFREIKEYFMKYSASPTSEALLITIDEKDNIDSQLMGDISNLLKVVGDDTEKTPYDWLLDTSEEWCKDRAIYNGVMDSIEIIRDESRSKGDIPEILKDALSTSFDSNIGHDFLEDYESRYDFYHTEEEKIPFDLEMMNKITKGGLPNKSLNICMAGTGVGKSLFMCHSASAYLAQGLNVLYITLEMAEERIAERIDANLLDTTIDDLHALPKDIYDSKMLKVKNKTNGQLIIKEYPTASAHSGHFRSLMNELALKKSFRPDVLFIDYLNICASARFKGGNISSYFYIKAIAEELRGLAVEFNVPIFSATQTTRTGFVSTDIGLEDTSESFGLPATADFMFALMSNDELEQLGQMKVKQLKNRYNDPAINRSFIIGVDRAKMKLYDVENVAQNIVDKGTQVETKDDPYDKFSDFKI